MESKYNKKYYENNKNSMFPDKERKYEVIEKIKCDFCDKFLTTLEIRSGRHYKNHCRGNPDYLYKGRKSGNFKKPEIQEEDQQPIKSEIDIKREEKKNFIDMINKLIRDKTMDIDTIYKIYGKQINEYKYIK